MQNHSGIYTKHQTSPLIFILDHEEIKGDLLSSLQSFETSLLMIGLGRWTNALISLTNGIEILIKIDKSMQRDLDFVDLIDSFCKTYGISENLRQCAHRVRKTRNDYVHRSLIPDDNDNAILTYMNDGLSVYKVFLEKSISMNLYESIASPDLCRNLVETKNLLKQKKDNLNVGLYLSVLIKTIANQIYPAVTPERLFDTSYADNSWIVFDKVKDQLEDWIEGTFAELEFIHDQIDCPCDCDGMISLGVEGCAKNGIKISVAYCTYCGLTLIPDELIKVFVLDQLGKDGVANIRKSYGIRD